MKTIYILVKYLVCKVYRPIFQKIQTLKYMFQKKVMTLSIGQGQQFKRSLIENSFYALSP